MILTISYSVCRRLISPRKQVCTSAEYGEFWQIRICLGQDTLETDRQPMLRHWRLFPVIICYLSKGVTLVLHTVPCCLPARLPPRGWVKHFEMELNTLGLTRCPALSLTLVSGLSSSAFISHQWHDLFHLPDCNICYSVSNASPGLSLLFSHSFCKKPKCVDGCVWVKRKRRTKY